jgi:peroxiredoxin 2/4
MPLLRLGDPAPQFTAQSTRGEISLSDYRGRWVLLFGYWADFTPVCSSEIIALARSEAAFLDLGVQVLAVSADSIFSHIAWIRSLEGHFDVKVAFPVIADTGELVSDRYGMVNRSFGSSNGARGLAIIGPDQDLRALLYQPPSVGRNVAEILRILKALQLSEASGLGTPEGWQPGGRCAAPAPTSVDGAVDRLSDMSADDWYLGMVDAPAS